MPPHSGQVCEEEYTVEVLELAPRRGSAAVAQTLYSESEESISRRQQQAAQRRMQRELKSGPEQRPDKRQRRRIIKFKSSYD